MRSIVSSPAIDNLSYPVIFCGSRHWRDRRIVMSILTALRAQHPALHVIHGNQETTDVDERYGADYIVKTICTLIDIPQTPYPADWRTHGRAAGPIRNEFMYDDNPDVRETIGLFAWDAERGELWPARGTQNCLRIGARRGIPQRYFYENETVEHVLSRLRAEAA